MRIEIISTGDEVITGSIDDTNASFLSRELIDVGLQVTRRHTVGDNLDELMKLFQEVAREPSIAIVTGGLGPTPDDLTTEAIARVAKVPLKLNEQWLERMHKWFESRGRTMAKANIKQAMLPQDSLFIDNPVGTACGFIVKINHSLFIFAPGVPRELKVMWEASIKDLVLSFTKNSIIQTKINRLFLMGIGESDLSEKIANVPHPQNIVIGDRAVYPYIELKIIGHNAEDAQMSKVSADLDELLERYTICKGEMDLKADLQKADLAIEPFHFIDALSRGSMPLEMQKLYTDCIDCSIFNTCPNTVEASKVSLKVALEHFHEGENLIMLLPKGYSSLWQQEDKLKEVNEIAKHSPFQYELFYHVNVRHQGSVSPKRGHVIFSFARDFYDETNYPRNREFIAKLCCVELYKILIGEKLIEPNECSVTHICEC